ncbi:MAG: family 10 glycosylhydrolase [Pseudomonadota bacterium]
MPPDLTKRAFALAGAAGALSLAGLLPACSAAPFKPTTPADGQPPPAPREFRAAWVSTVANIDWPSKPDLSSAAQQAEALAILDKAVALNLNAVVLQVRPSADAIYPSAREPWSEFLTGAQGRAPLPYYDPLAFWVSEAHARGLELHAWFNPYRARHTLARSPDTATHVSRTIPGAVKRYGQFLWMDPGDEAASRQTLEVILDVVRRYDIDGVHIDDYFYPYPIAAPSEAGVAAALDGAAAAPKAELDFPDQDSYARYTGAGGTLGKADWRRRNVDQLIEALYAGIHREKRWVRFGISPFGLGRPDRRPPGIAGFSQYDKLYADAELWLAKGWLDYLAPQLYWPITQVPQAYGVLLDYWLAQNSKGRHVWPGLYTSRVGAAEKSYAPDEIMRQVALTRTRPGAGGHIHFSMVALMGNRGGLADLLKAGPYAQPALVPATPWLGDGPPAAPRVGARREAAGVRLGLASARAGMRHGVWSLHAGTWRFALVPAGLAEWFVADDGARGPALAVVVSAFDRLGVESARVQAALAVP